MNELQNYTYNASGQSLWSVFLVNLSGQSFWSNAQAWLIKPTTKTDREVSGMMMMLVDIIIYTSVEQFAQNLGLVLEM